ncbi:NAD(P)-dependent dehydrogenase (short-subunit alcohol dehydrogenase family) [Nitrobacteraceae bacterium AZCC 1564]
MNEANSRQHHELKIQNPERLDGIPCFVTGGAQGIGFATARALAAKGGHVCLADLNLERARSSAAALATEFKIPTLAVPLDVGDENSITAAFAAAEKQFGHVGVLVNAAGIMTPRLGLAETISVDDFDVMCRIHLRGAFLCSQASIPQMERRGFGRIINISSVLGVTGVPFRIAYASAKTGINGFTKALAVETARRNITVNAVAPGYILTETLRDRLKAGMLDYMNYAERAPAGRWGLPEEVGRLIAFLALPGSAFITGTIIPVDGGYTMRGDPGESIGPRPEMGEVEAMFGIAK